MVTRIKRGLVELVHFAAKAFAVGHGLPVALRIQIVELHGLRHKDAAAGVLALRAVVPQVQVGGIDDHVCSPGVGNGLISRGVAPGAVARLGRIIGIGTDDAVVDSSQGFPAGAVARAGRCRIGQVAVRALEAGDGLIQLSRCGIDLLLRSGRIAQNGLCLRNGQIQQILAAFDKEVRVDALRSCDGALQSGAVDEFTVAVDLPLDNADTQRLRVHGHAQLGGGDGIKARGVVLVERNTKAADVRDLVPLTVLCQILQLRILRRKVAVGEVVGIRRRRW